MMDDLDRGKGDPPSPDIAPFLLPGVFTLTFNPIFDVTLYLGPDPTSVKLYAMYHNHNQVRRMPMKCVSVKYKCTSTIISCFIKIKIYGGRKGTAKFILEEMKFVECSVVTHA